jgi:hypothetical protein
MTNIANPTGVDGVIIIDRSGGIERVVPDEIVKKAGENVKWMVVPPKDVTLSFEPNESPFDWESRSSKPHGGVEITGMIQKNAKDKDYKYSVTDANGNTIDPRVKVRR